MITEIITNRCTKCQSENIVRIGKTKAGKQKYHCKTYHAYGTLNPSVPYMPERKTEILRAYHERASLRSIERTFGVVRQTVAAWLKEKADSLPAMPPLQEARTAIFYFIEVFYNRKRLHSTLGYVSPLAFENAHYQSKRICLN